MHLAVALNLPSALENRKQTEPQTDQRKLRLGCKSGMMPSLTILDSVERSGMNRPRHLVSVRLVWVIDETVLRPQSIGRVH